MKTILFSSILILHSVLSFGQGNGWEWQNPLPQGNTLNDIFFIDGQTGWAVGRRGTIIKTTDGGVTWENKSEYSTKVLNAVHFIDLQKGIAVGTGGIVKRTTDGGETWQETLLGNQTFLNSIAFQGNLIGWIVGQYGRLFKTTDGGI
ncbi:MAG TPA: YCF48-related protein, partial [Catalimonadaceae bacterium]|nr:YCF48-related protein [Catalimonadaceae bacterium]